MSDTVVMTFDRTKDGIERPFRKDAQENPALSFTAHEVVEVFQVPPPDVEINDNNAKPLATIRPGMVAIGLRKHFRQMPTRAECLASPKMLAYYYVLELISVTGAPLNVDGESHAVDALVLRVKEARDLFSWPELQKLNLRTTDLIISDSPFYIDVDLFIGVLDVVKKHRQEGRRFLAGCCANGIANMNGCSIKDIKRTAHEMAPVLKPADDVIEFFAHDSLDNTAPPLLQSQNYAAQYATKKRKTSQSSTDDDSEFTSNDADESVSDESVTDLPSEEESDKEVDEAIEPVQPVQPVQAAQPIIIYDDDDIEEPPMPVPAKEKSAAREEAEIPPLPRKWGPKIARGSSIKRARAGRDQKDDGAQDDVKDKIAALAAQKQAAAKVQNIQKMLQKAEKEYLEANNALIFALVNN